MRSPPLAVRIEVSTDPPRCSNALRRSSASLTRSRGSAGQPTNALKERSMSKQHPVDTAESRLFQISGAQSPGDESLSSEKRGPSCRL